MATSEETLHAYMEALAAEGLDRHALQDMEADLIGKVGRLRILRDRAIRDMEAARLLPHGAAAIIERMGGCRATAYNRAKRGRILSKSREAS